jgi:hypothetical protein
MHSPARYRNSSARASEVCRRPLYIIQHMENSIPSSRFTMHIVASERPMRCARAYRALFQIALSGADIHVIRETTNKNWVLGDERFKRQIEALTGRRASPARCGLQPVPDGSGHRLTCRTNKTHRSNWGTAKSLLRVGVWNRFPGNRPMIPLKTCWDCGRFLGPHQFPKRRLGEPELRRD